MKLSEDQKRRLNLAEWHARESLGRELTGDLDAAEHHLASAKEYLDVAYGRPWKVVGPTCVTTAVEMIRSNELVPAAGAND